MYSCNQIILTDTLLNDLRAFELISKLIPAKIAKCLSEQERF
jgi:hypothetical protein